MQDSILSQVLLPIALGIIMLGLGLGLTIADFKRVFVFPKAVFVGLICQMLLLPIACYFICTSLALPPELAVGMMLLAASPGGATANLYSHLAKGDVALNITLTAVNSVFSIFTLPFFVGFAISEFMGKDQQIPLQFGKMLQVFAIVLVPVGLGMLIRAKREAFADSLGKPVKIVSLVFLILVIAAAILKERATIGTSIQAIGIAALLFNLVSMLSGYFIPLMVRLPEKQAIAIGMEIGIHNGTLAIAVATTVLGNSTMSVPAAIYSLIMFFTAAVFGWIVSKRVEASPKHP